DARQHVADAVGAELAEPIMQLKPFRAHVDGAWMVARTGYTGEDGFELALPAAEAVPFWRRLLNAGVTPAGLGARDTLRLEAGLNLYGQDMDEDHHPLESGLGWTVAFKPAERTFIGREALEAVRAQDAAERNKLVGLLLQDRGVLRSGQALRAASDDNDDPEQAGGRFTSGGFAPTLQRSIGFARVPAHFTGAIEVNMRKRWLRAHIVDYPFVRNGKPAIDI